MEAAGLPPSVAAVGFEGGALPGAAAVGGANVVAVGAAAADSGAKVERAVLGLVGLESGHEAIDVGVGGGRGPARLGGVDGCAEVAQNAVGPPLGLDLVQLGLTLLRGVLGHDW